MELDNFKVGCKVMYMKADYAGNKTVPVYGTLIEVPTKNMVGDTYSVRAYWDGKEYSTTFIANDTDKVWVVPEQKHFPIGAKVKHIRGVEIGTVVDIPVDAIKSNKFDDSHIWVQYDTMIDPVNYFRNQIQLAAPILPQQTKFKVGTKVAYNYSPTKLLGTVIDLPEYHWHNQFMGDDKVWTDAHGGSWSEIDKVVEYIEPNKQEKAMNKELAQERIQAIQKELTELQAIINAPDVKPALLEVPPADVRPYRIDGSSNGFKCAVSSYPQAPFTSYKESFNAFTTKELAQDYAEAFLTMLELRRQPGTIPYTPKGVLIAYDKPAVTIDTVHPTVHIHSASPCFDSNESAKAAINKVGKDKLIKMFKTLHHIK